MRFSRLLTSAVVVAGLGFLMAACAGPGPTSTPTPSPAPSPTPHAPVISDAVNLPGDEGIHLAPVEWWYFNGHLRDSVGNRYSFHFVNFITVTGDGQIPQLMQLSLADHGEGLYLTDEEPALVNNLQPTQGSFSFDMAGWHMSGAVTGFESTYELVFNTGDYVLDLPAKSQSPAVLHQGEGLVDLGRAGKTFYYSRTRLDISGTLTRNGMPFQVAGIAWMDHQWGDFSTQPIGWDWASLQLDDGSELMISLVWDSSTGQPITSYGTYVPMDTAALNLAGGDISLTSTGTWTSEATGTTYPMGWNLTVASRSLDLTLTPVQQDAEYSISKFIPPAYWEGAVVAKGTKNGQPVSGRGFVELVGYDTREFDSPGLGQGR